MFGNTAETTDAPVDIQRAKMIKVVISAPLSALNINSIYDGPNRYSD